MAIIQKHCPECGAKLTEKYMKTEGMVPYCPECSTWRFPFFNTAVSMIVIDEKTDKILLIKQYGKDYFLLVSGYVDHGESLENAVRREVKEETGLDIDIDRMIFNRSELYEPSNTLMVNFTCYVQNAEMLEPNEEVDSWDWFDLEEAREGIKKGSQAEMFLNKWLDEREDVERRTRGDRLPVLKTRKNARGM